MTQYVAGNDAYSTLAGSLTDVATSMTVQTGHGDRYPVITNGVNHTVIDLEDASHHIERVKVTARAAASDTMTIVRAQEGTTARAWSIGDIVECRPTAGAMNDKMSLSSNNNMAAANNEARATVASHATTADIWGALGNSIDWTGTATTTAFPNAPQAGASRELICAGACSFTAGANMLIDGVTSGNTVICAANDIVAVTAVSATQFKLRRIRYDGKAQVETVSLAANNFTGGQNFSRATVASHATTADIWAAAGNQIDWTGTATTTAFPNAPQAGASRRLICAGACSFTAGANMLIAGVSSGNTVTCSAGDMIDVEAVSTTQFKLTRIKYDGTPQVAGSPITLGTPVATTSGTAIDFTISAGAKKIDIEPVGVSTNGTSYLLVQIGDAGGIETTRYDSTSTELESGSTIQTDNSTAGFLFRDGSSAASLRSGIITLSLENSSANTWCCTGGFKTGTGKATMSFGNKSLSQSLTTVRITTVNGTDSFDAGELNITAFF